MTLENFTPSRNGKEAKESELEQNMKIMRAVVEGGNLLPGDTLVSKSGTRRKIIKFIPDETSLGEDQNVGNFEVEVTKEGTTTIEKISNLDVISALLRGVVTIEKGK